MSDTQEVSIIDQREQLAKKVAIGLGNPALAEGVREFNDGHDTYLYGVLTGALAAYVKGEEPNRPKDLTKEQKRARFLIAAEARDDLARYRNALLRQS